jgi:hypothetical protein
MKTWAHYGAYAALLAAGLSAGHWYITRPLDLPRLPSNLAQSDESPSPQEPYRPIPCPVVPHVPGDDEVLEPIVVLPESLEAPAPPWLPDVDPGSAETNVAGSTVPGPRPEAYALRMPYAEEEVSEFALLLQRAGEWRGLPDEGPPLPFAAEESALPPGFDGTSEQQTDPRTMRCPYLDRRALPYHFHLLPPR